jgi:hypothetical protein
MYFVLLLRTTFKYYLYHNRLVVNRRTTVVLLYKRKENPGARCSLQRYFIWGKGNNSAIVQLFIFTTFAKSCLFCHNATNCTIRYYGEHISTSIHSTRSTSTQYCLLQIPNKQISKRNLKDITMQSTKIHVI